MRRDSRDLKFFLVVVLALGYAFQAWAGTHHFAQHSLGSKFSAIQVQSQNLEDGSCSLCDGLVGLSGTVPARHDGFFRDMTSTMDVLAPSTRVSDGYEALFSARAPPCDFLS